MIEPYPKTIDISKNKETIKEYKLPLNLDFRRMNEVDTITPDEAWTNRAK